MLWSSTEWKCLQRINRYMPDKPRTCCADRAKACFAQGELRDKWRSGYASRFSERTVAKPDRWNLEIAEPGRPDEG
jgi:hypothetical protein